jgi:flavin-dependent dehydrogenase
MSRAQWDVLIVGAGHAGLTAAVALARAGLAVGVVEAAAAPGAADGTDVIDIDLLAATDVLGGGEVASLAIERRLVERGRFLTDGVGCLGATYRDPDLFRSQVVVLRSRFLGGLADAAVRSGAQLWTKTLAEGLIREGGRVIGLSTTAGPLDANLVFLAEGAAAGLVAREGLERTKDPRDAPRYLLALEAVFDLPAGATEERFGLGAEEGTAHDFLLRNFQHDGRDLPLNLRGWMHTLRQGVSLGVWLPVENLRRYSSGSPAALFERIQHWPALRPWLADGRRGAVSARVVRGGGARDVPYLVADGVAVGGAAAGGDVTFPYPRCAEGAIAGGALLARAVLAIRHAGGRFDREALARHYAEPLQQLPLWQDLEHLRRWPPQVRRSPTLFGPDLDLLLRTAHVWTRPKRWLVSKAASWLRLLVRSGGWAEWRRIQEDLQGLGWALQMRSWAGRPSLRELLLDGSLNALRDLVGKARPDVPPAGQFAIHYHCAAPEGDGSPPRFVQRWLRRVRPVVSAAIAEVLHDVKRSLPARLAAAVRLLVRQVNLLDLILAAVLAVLTAVLVGLGSLAAAVRRRRSRSSSRRWTYADAVQATVDQSSIEPTRIEGDTSPLIRLLWPRTLPEGPSWQNEGVARVCPSEVFEVGPVLHPERCVGCEACWRASRLVDWGRVSEQPTGLKGKQPHKPEAQAKDDALPSLALQACEAAKDDALPSLALQACEAAKDDALPSLALQACGDRGEHYKRDAPAKDHPDAVRQATPTPERLLRLLDQLEDKLSAFDHVLQRGPDNIDRGRADHLELLARYAERLAVAAAEALGGPGRELAAKAAERTQRTWNGNFIAASADGRELRQHHLAQLRHQLGAPECRIGLRPVESVDRPEAYPTVDAAVAALLRSTPDRGVPAGLDDTERALRRDLLDALAEDLGAPVPAGTAFRRLACRLRDGWEKARGLLQVEGEVAELRQRQVLLGEWEEVERAEGQLAGLAADWAAGRDPAAESAATDASLAEAFARQAAWQMAERLVLLQLHDHLEEHPDAEMELALMRVVFETAARDLLALADAVEERLTPEEPRQRPLLDPGFRPPPASLSEYLAAPAAPQEGDFLLAPVDLVRPRLVPEMLPAALPEVPAAVAPLVAAAAAIKALVQRGEGNRLHAESRDDRLAFTWRLQELEAAAFLADALTASAIGCALAAPPAAPLLDNESALLLTDLLRRRAEKLAEVEEEGGIERALPEELGHGDVVVRRLLEVVAPVCRIDEVLPPRHLSTEALELEARKSDFRLHLVALAAPLRAIPSRTVERLALQKAPAEAAAWLLGADVVLGRLAWLARKWQVEEPDDPAPLPSAGRRAFNLCLAEMQSRLQRIDDHLLALRRGYWPARARAAVVLRHLVERPQGQV